MNALDRMVSLGGSLLGGSVLGLQLAVIASEDARIQALSACAGACLAFVAYSYQNSSQERKADLLPLTRAIAEGNQAPKKECEVVQGVENSAIKPLDPYIKGSKKETISGQNILGPGNLKKTVEALRATRKYLPIIPKDRDREFLLAMGSLDVWYECYKRELSRGQLKNRSHHKKEFEEIIYKIANCEKLLLNSEYGRKKRTFHSIFSSQKNSLKNIYEAHLLLRNIPSQEVSFSDGTSFSGSEICLRPCFRKGCKTQGNKLVRDDVIVLNGWSELPEMEATRFSPLVYNFLNRLI